MAAMVLGTALSLGALLAVGSTFPISPCLCGSLRCCGLHHSIPRRAPPTVIPIRAIECGSSVVVVGCRVLVLVSVVVGWSYQQ
jgi:hypothetical protein